MHGRLLRAVATGGQVAVNRHGHLHGFEIAQGIAAGVAWRQGVFDHGLEAVLTLGRALPHVIVELQIGPVDEPSAPEFFGG
jgi:hypothetical protein